MHFYCLTQCGPELEFSELVMLCNYQGYLLLEMSRGG
jgi:hypothetical protein